MPTVYVRINTDHDGTSGTGALVSPVNFNALRTTMATYKVSPTTKFDLVLLGTRAEKTTRTIEDDFGTLINDSSIDRRVRFNPKG